MYHDLGDATLGEGAGGEVCPPSSPEGMGAKLPWAGRKNDGGFQRGFTTLAGALGCPPGKPHWAGWVGKNNHS